MKPQPARRLRDIAATELVDPVDVFPARTVGRHRPQDQATGRCLPQQGQGQVIRIRRLRQVVSRPEPDGGDGARNGTEGGEHHRPGVRSPAQKVLDQGQTGSIDQPHFQYGEAWGTRLNEGRRLGQAARAGHLEATRLQPPGHAQGVKRVVIHQEKVAPDLRRLGFCGVGSTHERRSQDQTLVNPRNSPSPAQVALRRQILFR